MKTKKNPEESEYEPFYVHIECMKKTQNVGEKWVRFRATDKIARWEIEAENLRLL